MQTTRVITAAASLPLTEAEACAHLRMEVGQDTIPILAAVAAATASIEESYGVAMVTQTLATVFDAWGGFLVLSRGPVASVTSIKYTPAGAAQVTLATTEYVVAAKSSPIYITPPFGKLWPFASLERVDPIEVTYVAGVAVELLPAVLKQAVGILTSSFYFDSDAGGSDPKTMRAVDHLLRQRRLW